MSMIEKAIRQVHAVAVSGAEHGWCPNVDVRAQILVVIAFIIVVLSVPISDPASLLWLFCFPIVMSEAMRIGYGRLMAKSLWILPFIAGIGIFNPLFDRASSIEVAGFVMSRGWLSFTSLLLRALLTYQGLLLLVSSYGFYDVCRAIQYYKCPSALVTQLLMLYRYIGVLLTEALTMQRARASRGYGRKSYPLKMWGIFAGQLLVRSIQRAKRVHSAMTARGFNGRYYFKPFDRGLRLGDWGYIIGWSAVFGIARFYDLTMLVSRIMTR